MDTNQARRIEWRFIAPGAVILLLGLINVGRMNTPGTAWANGASQWPIALAVM